MKKIGLATCFVDNYGACLQAHALQHTIEECGYKCEIINFIEPIGYPKRHTMIEKIKQSSHVKKLYSIFSSSYRPIYEQRKKFNIFREKYLNISKDIYASTNQIINNPPIYDGYVCGSDQIWNPKFYNGNNKVYFLDFVPSGKHRIAYAPSIGLTDFPNEYAEEFKKLVEKFDVISVREQEGKEIIESLTDREAKVVLDPTLLCDGEYWGNIATAIPKEEPFIFCYIFGDKPYMQDFLRRAYKETGYKIFYTSFTSWGDKIENGECIEGIGPSEFLWMIQNAKMVITDSFHATVFSINFNTPFYTLLRNDTTDKINMNSRIFSILKMLGLEGRIIDANKMPKNIQRELDFTLANKKLDESRKADKEFLFNSLKEI